MKKQEGANIENKEKVISIEERGLLIELSEVQIAWEEILETRQATPEEEEAFGGEFKRLRGEIEELRRGEKVGLITYQKNENIIEIVDEETGETSFGTVIKNENIDTIPEDPSNTKTESYENQNDEFIRSLVEYVRFEKANPNAVLTDEQEEFTKKNRVFLPFINEYEEYRRKSLEGIPGIPIYIEYRKIFKNKDISEIPIYQIREELLINNPVKFFEDILNNRGKTDYDLTEEKYNEIQKSLEEIRNIELEYKRRISHLYMTK